MTNASLWRRLGAMLYDGLLVIAVLFAVSVPVVALNGGEPIGSGNLPYQALLLTAAYVFFTGFWYRYGRTLGMQSWGLRIEAAGGGRPSLAQCTIRFFASIVSWLPLGLGYLWQLVDRDGSSWHDRLSGTRLNYYPKKKQG